MSQLIDVLDPMDLVWTMAHGELTVHRVEFDGTLAPVSTQAAMEAQNAEDPKSVIASLPKLH